MGQVGSLKIDVFSHILPAKYKQALDDAAPGHVQQVMNNAIPTLWDLDARFRVMDKYDQVQVLTLSRPPIEEVIDDPQKALDLTRLGNDEMAELVLKYPSRFPAAVAAVSLTDVDGSLKELERAVNDLKFRGVQIYTNVKGKPLNSPEYLPLFEMMARFNLPVWIHPTFGITATDYSTEKGSRYSVAGTFGWPYETTMAMNRLVFGGILERWPNLKVIAHHGGAMIPYFAERIAAFHDYSEMNSRSSDKIGLTRTPIEYYKMFYADTAICGNTPALMLTRAFFGIDNMLYGTDFPFAGQHGERVVRQTIKAIEDMDIPETEKKKIMEDNARRIMRLPI